MIKRNNISSATDKRVKKKFIYTRKVDFRIEEDDLLFIQHLAMELSYKRGENITAGSVLRYAVKHLRKTLKR